MIARIVTSTASAKEILDSQLNGLKQAFSSQNLQVEKIEISQQMTQQERAFNKDPQHQGQGQQQNQEDKNPQPDSKFNNSFEEALLNTEV
jgi:flagellar hook-length control protein FliK